MPKYELTSDLLTGHSLIDGQHLELFKAINNLMEACASGKGRTQLEATYIFLRDYIAKHFADEERLQKAEGYPDYSRHHNIHEEYKNFFAKSGRELLANGATVKALADLNMAVATLINHVRLEDKKVAAYIKSK